MCVCVEGGGASTKYTSCVLAGMCNVSGADTGFRKGGGGVVRVTVKY